MNHDLAALQHRVLRNWNCVWKLKLPPKVKNILWRACHNYFPKRVWLQSKGVQCPDQCTMREESAENSTHLFFMCSKSVLCWKPTR